MRHLLILTALITTSVYAQQDYPRDIVLDWLNADQYVDGTLMEAGDLASVHFDCYRQNDTVPMMSITIPANGEGLQQTETFTGVIPNPGTYRCEGFSVTLDDIYSDASAPAFKKFTGKPKAMTILTFE